MLLKQTEQYYIVYERSNTQSVTRSFMEVYGECFVLVDVISTAPLFSLTPTLILLRGLKVTFQQPPLLITGN
jgi:hypothetical protein